MSVFLVAQAIKTRLEADTGTGGLFNAGSAYKLSAVYTKQGGNGATLFPYAVIEPLTANDDSAMWSMNAVVEWTITVYDDAANGEAKLWPILNRILGDAILQSSQRPSYGLWMHVLVLDTDSGRNPFAVTGNEISIDGHDYGQTSEPVAAALVVRGKTSYQKQGA